MADGKKIADGIEILAGGDALVGGLNDSELGDPGGAGTTSPGFTGGECRWAEAVSQSGGDWATGSTGLTAGGALIAGAAGALTVTLVNETARRFIPAAPRLDELGIRGLAKGLRKAGQAPPPRDTLFWLSMAGDLVSNGLFYSLAGRGDTEAAWGRGALLGGLMGLGAATLPEPFGLGRGPTARSAATRAMTVAWYLLGGLAAAGAASQLSGAAQDEGGEHA